MSTKTPGPCAILEACGNKDASPREDLAFVALFTNALPVMEVSFRTCMPHALFAVIFHHKLWACSGGGEDWEEQH